MACIARAREIIARRLLASPDRLSEALAACRWAEVFCLAEFIENDIPRVLAASDPALYRTLRAQLTELHIRGYAQLNVERLRELADADDPVCG